LRRIEANAILIRSVRFSWPSGTYPEWKLWQYSETGEIPGIDDSYVDLDKFSGSDAAFLTWINAEGVFRMPVPPPEPSEMVNIAVTAPDNISVRVTVNGHAVRVHRLLRRAKRGPDVLR
jgi:lysozyme